MLLEKYRPRSLNDVIGNARQIAAIRHWLARPQGALLLHGPPGCGKSLCVELIAAEGGYEIAESHASDSRGYAALKDSLMKAMSQQSLFHKKKIIVIDEIELIDSMKAITEIVAGSRCPVILVTSDPYDKKLAQLRRSCTLVRFDKIRSDSIEKLLRRICDEEKISANAVAQLARSCNGDVRAAIIDLEWQAGEAGLRDKEESVFETLKILFKTLDLANSRYAVSASEKSPEELLLWVEENIPQEYERAEEIAAAYDWLSKADIIAARIMRRQSWSLQKYAAAFLCGVSFAKRNAYKKFTPYAYPKARFAREPAIAGQIARKLHVSRKEALRCVPLLVMVKNRAVLAEQLGIGEDDIAALS